MMTRLALLFVLISISSANPTVTTLVGTGAAGYSDIQVNNPYGLVIGPDGALYFCDLDNQRIRRLHLETGIIEAYSGTGEAKPTPDGAAVRGAPLNGPRTLALAANGDLYVALREGNAIYRIDAASQKLYHVAGTGEQGYAGDGGPALSARLGGPKGIAIGTGNILYIADTENHVIRRIDLKSGIITA